MKARFDIIKYRKWFFMLSGLITVLGILAFAFFGFNLGTDFKAGSRVQLDLGQSITTSDVQKLFRDAGLQVPSGQITLASAQAGQPRDTAIVRFTTQLNQKQIQQIKDVEQKDFAQSKGLSSEMVDPFVANQTARKAVWSVLLAALCIVIYVAIRFEIRFAVAAIIALLHDAFIVMSFFALFRMEVDLTFVAAVLTIVGYSINDTIVIFDRIRENVKLTPPRSFDELEHLTNKSLWQTMSRSINTVITVLVAALLLYLFGGESIRTFTLALVIGLVSGAYSSIFIASPIWVAWRGRSLGKGKKSTKAETA